MPRVRLTVDLQPDDAVPRTGGAAAVDSGAQAAVTPRAPGSIELPYARAANRTAQGSDP